MSNAFRFLHELLFRFDLVYLVHKCSCNTFHVNLFGVVMKSFAVVLEPS